MGSRDFRKREKKKAKKEEKKSIPISTELNTPTTVEIIKKGKRKPKSEEQE